MIPGGEAKIPTPAFLPGEFHGQRSGVSYSPWGPKESDTTEQLTFHKGRVGLLFPHHALLYVCINIHKRTMYKKKYVKRHTQKDNVLKL